MPINLPHIISVNELPDFRRFAHFRTSMESLHSWQLVWGCNEGKQRKPRNINTQQKEGIRSWLLSDNN
jgi:hypothetical protein